MDKIQSDHLQNQILGEAIKFHLEIDNNFKLYSFRVITPEQFLTFTQQYISMHGEIIEKLVKESTPPPPKTQANGQQTLDEQISEMTANE